MEKERRNENRYKELLKTKPGIIIGSASETLEASDRALLRSRLENASSICCEIGSGSGEHLIKQASKNPKTLWVGLELRYKRIYRTAEKAEAAGVKNLLVLRHNAKQISEIFQPRSLSGIYINFPDPWSGKRRWEKHSLLTLLYLETLEKLLKPSGFISYKTDHRERFLQIYDNFKKLNNFMLTKVTQDLVTSEFYSENIASEFEKLFVRQNLPIYSLHAAKKE